MGIILNDTGGGTLKKFIKILMSAFSDLNIDLNSYVNLKRDELKYTAAINSLTRLLNETFDPVTRGIYIVNGNDIYSGYKYDYSEGFGYYIYRYNETPQTSKYTLRFDETSNENDFIVYVPSSVSFDVAYMTSLIKDYVFADKEFEIIKI